MMRVRVGGVSLVCEAEQGGAGPGQAMAAGDGRLGRAQGVFAAVSGSSAGAAGARMAGSAAHGHHTRRTPKAAGTLATRESLEPPREAPL